MVRGSQARVLSGDSINLFDIVSVPMRWRPAWYPSLLHGTLWTVRNIRQSSSKKATGKVIIPNHAGVAKW